MKRARRALDTIGEAANAFDTFKAWVGSLVILGAGAVVLVGPGKMPDRFPQHRLAGAAILVLGVVFLLSFLWGDEQRGLRRQVGKRCRALLFLLVFVGVGAAHLFTFGRETWDLWRLSQGGVHATAEVGQAKLIFDDEGSRVFEYRLHFDGFSPLVDLGRAAQEGQQVEVLYLDGEPAVLRVEPMGDDLISLLRGAGLGNVIMSGLVLLVCSLAALFNALIFLKGPGPAPEGGGRGAGPPPSAPR